MAEFPGQLLMDGDLVTKMSQVRLGCGYLGCGIFVFKISAQSRLVECIGGCALEQFYVTHQKLGFGLHQCRI